MGSFYAELTVGGETYPLRQCHYEFTQATDQRGRAAAKVRHSELTLVLDVPEGEGLRTWAAARFKPLGGHITFFDDAQRTALETVHFEAGHCIGYREHFHSGDTTSGAYVCHLTIVAEKLTLSAGGPPSPFVAPAPREVGSNLSNSFKAQDYVKPTANNLKINYAVDLLDAHTLERENSSSSDKSDSGLKSIVNGITSKVAPEVLAMLGNSIHIEELEPFVERVIADLHLIYNTATGKKLLDSIHASGKKVDIQYSMGSNDIGEYDNPKERFYQDELAKKPGKGTSSKVNYNPALLTVGTESWGTRPPAIALAHELIHVEQAAYGRMLNGSSRNGALTDQADNRNPIALIRELETVGIPPYDKYPLSENKIRQEWNPPQPKREFY